MVDKLQIHAHRNPNPQTNGNKNLNTDEIYTTNNMQYNIFLPCISSLIEHIIFLSVPPDMAGNIACSTLILKNGRLKIDIYSTVQ